VAPPRRAARETLTLEVVMPRRLAYLGAVLGPLALPAAGPATSNRANASAAPREPHGPLEAWSMP
jgi:hypothetical protein